MLLQNVEAYMMRELPDAYIVYIEQMTEGTEWVLEAGDPPFWSEDEELEDAEARLKSMGGLVFCIAFGAETIMGICSSSLGVLSCFVSDED
jgi:hypothetical protein